ncbi:hypothetical protein Tco_0747661 [Tanacetum coccineum]|uniref:Uncharacterized protein n=1 Tax=Tanacetum coccineum TaxID=301880 RepID=A0ABQ4YTM9_9ASTR
MWCFGWSRPYGELDGVVSPPDELVNISGPSGELDGTPTLPDGRDMTKTPYDCRVTIRSKLKMIPKIKERISSSKKRLDLFKNAVFGKWLDLDDTNYDNHLLNYVLHHQRPNLSKSVDPYILFDIAGRTLLLGRAEFCLVTGFTCGKVVFPK